MAKITLISTPLTRAMTVDQLQRQGLRLAPQKLLGKSKGLRAVRYIPGRPSNGGPDLVA